jgi:hypothetical protein
MDKHLNTEELKFQSLLEEKNFDQLNERERAFVTTFSSEKEYILQRKIIVDSQVVFEDKTLVAPPLVISNNPGHSIWFKKAPVYQTLLAVAATVVIMLLLRTPQESLVKKEVVTEYVTQTDTIYETQILRDTFVEYVDKEIVVEKIKYVEVEKKDVGTNSNITYAQVDEVNRKLTPALQVSLPDIKEVKESPAEISYKNDPTSILVSDFRLND